MYGDTLCAQVTATALAQTGHEVVWYVTEQQGWQALEQGGAIYHEQGLRLLLDEQCGSGRLKYRFWDGQDDVADVAVVFVSLQPGSVSMAERIARMHATKPGCSLLVNQTMGPVGTSEAIRDTVKEVNPAMAVVALPDLIQQGNAFDTFTRPVSILLGCEDEQAGPLMYEIMRPFNRRKDVIQLMSLREAEFAKLAISGILATRISFMNDMAHLS
ncbi:MAG: UDP-glucose/GDP-mannose dehydrogenase family protein, partial [Alcanivorax sp.]